MGAFMFCVFYCLGMLFVSAVVGTEYTTAAGVVAAFIVTAAVFSAADLSVYLLRGPLHRVSNALMRARELGALIIVLIMFAIVGSIAGCVIWSWSALAPQAFTSNPMSSVEAFRLGFSAALLDGILVAIGFPNRFAELAKLATRYQGRR